MKYEDIKSVIKTEPRIVQIGETISNLCKIVDFECDGKPVVVNGFKLKDLSNWITHNYYDTEEIIAHLARRCDSDCKFCYHKGNPPNFALGKTDDFVSASEINTRLGYYNPDKKTALFSAIYEQKEVLYDPKCIKYLKELRQKTNSLFTINTNGLGLTEDTIRELKLLSPVLIVFSINYTNQKKRDSIMQNTKANDSFKILSLLKKYEIPFIGSFVMWPTIEVTDIEEAIQSTASYLPFYLRLIMPGYTKYLPEQPQQTPKQFDEHFQECVQRILTLRKYVDVPLVIFPEAYVAKMENKESVPYLTGVVNNSPLYNAGVRAGDIIIGINGIDINMRHTALNVLQMLQEYPAPFSVTVLHDSNITTVSVNPSDNKYPFTYLENAPFGALISGGLSLSYIEKIEDAIERIGAKNILLMTSELMISQAYDLYKKANVQLENEKRKIEFCIPKNIYLGGNICIGDMLCVADYIEAVRVAQENNKQIDLVLVPSSAFISSNGWKRDMAGIYYKHIEWETGIRTEIFDCQSNLF